MSSHPCPQCGNTIEPMARYCSRCGRASTSVKVVSAASQLACAGVVGLELVCMGIVAWFVAPRLSHSLMAAGGPRSLLTSTVFSAWWMPVCMIPVATCGVVAIVYARTVLQRVALTFAALVLGAAPMAVTLAGIYASTFEQADAAATAP